MILTKEQLEQRRKIAQRDVEENVAPFVTMAKSDLDFLDTLDDLTRQRDTAHAAAIQAAAGVVNTVVESDHPLAWLTLLQRANASNRIRALTPADAQRCCDLRIAEAVRDEAEWWEHLFCYADTCEMFNKVTDGRQRLASASAEVERLQSQEVNTKGESI